MSVNKDELAAALDQLVRERTGGASAAAEKAGRKDERAAEKVGAKDRRAEVKSRVFSEMSGEALSAKVLLKRLEELANDPNVMEDTM